MVAASAVEVGKVTSRVTFEKSASRNLMPMVRPTYPLRYKSSATRAQSDVKITDNFSLSRRACRSRSKVVSPIIDALRHVPEPGRIAASKMILQEAGVGFGKIADGQNPQGCQFLCRFGADAVNLAGGKRTYPRGNVIHADDSQAVGLLQIGADFCEQFVRCNTDRA